MKRPIPLDTRLTHGFGCYCESCCATAQDWYEWRNLTDDNASGSRYWLPQDALKDSAAAKADDLLRLVHQPDDHELGRFVDGHFVIASKERA